MKKDENNKGKNGLKALKEIFKQASYDGAKNEGDLIEKKINDARENQHEELEKNSEGMEI